MTADLAGSVNGLASRKLTPGDRRQLVRALAADDVTRAALARRYGVSRAYVTQFAARHAAEVERVRASLDDEFAGMWIADKGARIAAYQDDYQQAADHEKADHHEWIKARTSILHTVAEELGQLPPRQTVTVMPVVHIVEGVNLDQLR